MLHRPFIGLDLLFEMETLFSTRNEATRATCCTITGNCLHFTSSDLCKRLQECKEIASSYGPVARLWIFPVLEVALTDPDSIESVVKQDKLLGRGYLDRKIREPSFRNGLICIDGHKWRSHCKIVSSGFQVNIWEIFVENFTQKKRYFSEKVERCSRRCYCA
jgi:hypothetical protein